MTQGLFSQFKTPQELALRIMSMTPEELSQVDHASLYAAREYIPKELQGDISPYEHQAFTREATSEDPFMALPLVVGTLAYQPYKMVMGARSKPSLKQTKQGLKGIGEGLMKKIHEVSASLDYADPFGLSIK
jgi:hypothetical protein